MPVLRRALPALLVLTASLTACEIERTPRPAAIDVDSVARVDIQSTLDAYHDALLAGDADRAASFFTAESRLFPPDAPDVVGADAIRSVMSGYFDGARVTAIALDRDGIDMIRGGGAWELGSYTETFRVDGGPEQFRRGRYAVRWRRGPETGWIIDAFLLNHYPADSIATR